MPSYTAPLRDFQFLTQEFLELGRYADVPDVGNVGADLVTPVLAEAGKFCEEVLFPLNQPADLEGCHWKNGKVTTPHGFKEAYQAYVMGGWSSFTCDPVYGGQGLPEWLNMGVVEMMCSANLAFGITPGLSHAAYNALALHASDAIKKAYLPKLVEGVWSGVMCLTEPQCGTDLGLIRTQAVPKGKKYAISGTKIFISAGEQDVTENILHLVLARLPDAPAGVKGISLFLVPKIKLKPDGSLGSRNKVKCLSIEHKMGIHASPTCVMEYDGAEGFLLGEPHRGLKAMFTMMNAARLYVGVQGLGLAEVATQNAVIYAKERFQGRSPSGVKHPDKPADPLIVHPDVRRNLLIMKSFVEGARALMLHTALQLDLSHRHPDPETRLKADEWVQILTPVIKGYFTDMGFDVANLGMQIYGGYGYIRDYGMEQYARDARIAQIYEGANGIQGLDLVGRKLPAHTGRSARRFFHPLADFIEEHNAHPQLAPMIKTLKTHMGTLQKASLWLAQKGVGNPEEAAAGATEYLRMFGLVALGFMWARMAVIAAEKLSSGTSEAAFYQSKIDLAQFFMAKMLPQCFGLLAGMTTGAKPVMGMKEEAF